MKNCLAVIGGSGLYDIEGVKQLGEERVDTPFGAPSDVIVRAEELCRPVARALARASAGARRPGPVGWRFGGFRQRQRAVSLLSSLASGYGLTNPINRVLSALGLGEAD